MPGQTPLPWAPNVERLNQLSKRPSEKLWACYTPLRWALIEL